jgi:hypothetical protein
MDKRCKRFAVRPRAPKMDLPSSPNVCWVVGDDGVAAFDIFGAGGGKPAGFTAGPVAGLSVAAHVVLMPGGAVLVARLRRLRRLH